MENDKLTHSVALGPWEASLVAPLEASQRASLARLWRAQVEHHCHRIESHLAAHNTLAAQTHQQQLTIAQAQLTQITK
jgi:hypothetical protein